MGSLRDIGTSQDIYEHHLKNLIWMSLIISLFTWQMMRFRRTAKIMESMRKVISCRTIHFKDILIIQCRIKNMILKNRSCKKWKKLLQMWWELDLCSSILNENKGYQQEKHVTFSFMEWILWLITNFNLIWLRSMPIHV